MRKLTPGYWINLLFFILLVASLGAFAYYRYVKKEPVAENPKEALNQPVAEAVFEESPYGDDQSEKSQPALADSDSGSVVKPSLSLTFSSYDSLKKELRVAVLVTPKQTLSGCLWRAENIVGAKGRQTTAPDQNPTGCLNWTTTTSQAPKIGWRFTVSALGSNQSTIKSQCFTLTEASDLENLNWQPCYN